MDEPKLSTIDWPATIDLYFPECRRRDEKIQATDKTIDIRKANLKLLWKEYQYKARKLQLQIAAFERRLTVEEIYLKQKITLDIKVELGLAVHSRRHRVLKGKITINDTIQIKNETNQTEEAT